MQMCSILDALKLEKGTFWGCLERVILRGQQALYSTPSIALSPNFLYTLFTIYSNSVILNKNSVSYARMIDYRTGTRSPPRDRLGAGGAVWLLQLTLYPHCMNVTGNPVIYCLEGSVQFFLPDQIAHFLEKEAKIFQHMDCSHPSSSTLGSTHICRHPEDPTFSNPSPPPPLC